MRTVSILLAHTLLYYAQATHPWVGKGVNRQLTRRGREQMRTIGARLRRDLIEVQHRDD